MSDSDATPPRCVAGALTPYRSPPNNTLKGVHWSPDGLCLLAASEDRKLRLFELPEGLQHSTTLNKFPEMVPNTNELPNPLTILEGDAVYDYAWYPAMDSAQPATCCFASSSRDFIQQLLRNLFSPRDVRVHLGQRLLVRLGPLLESLRPQHASRKLILALQM